MARLEIVDLMVRSVSKMMEQAMEMETVKTARMIMIRMSFLAGVSQLGAKRVRE